MGHPYQGAEDHQMWRRAVTAREPHLVNPAVAAKFQIDPDTKVATAGSCFAQHISRKISQLGFKYFVPEAGATLPEAERIERNFGVFSARFGNLYTVAQLMQLFEEAFGTRLKAEIAWQRPDGRFVDAYRPNVEPAGYATPEDVLAARKEHLGHVRDMFSNCGLFVFTLGLTEAWRLRQDGSVLPLAPGVAAGAYDPERYEFHNFSIDEVRDGLRQFVTALRGVNPGVRILLTVSPVPLMATYEPRHVLASTTYSKSVLRVAAQETVDAFDFVDYFPSFEIITGSPTGGLYFEPDHREVNTLGVAHAMRCFIASYTAAGPRPEAGTRVNLADEAHGTQQGSQVICDEEMLGDIS